MKNIKSLFVVLFVISSVNVSAQAVDDIFNLSFQTRTNSSARSVAMGGAFTSLGADIASVSINPAGLGMYRANNYVSTEIVITPSLIFSTAKNDLSVGDGSVSSFSNSQTNMIVNNFSWIRNVYSPKAKGVKGFTMAVSYDTNSKSKYTSSVESPGSEISIGDYFAAQLYGINPDDITGSSTSMYSKYSSGLWGAIMSYNNYLLEEKTETDGYDYFIHPLTLSSGDMVAPSQVIKEDITNYNLSFSLALNIDDILFLGATFGASYYDYRMKNSYNELGYSDNVGDFVSLNYFQANNVTASAFDLKLGATVEPIVGLKIGVAYHLPKLYYVIDEYYSDLTNVYINTEDSNYIDTYSQSSPYSLLEYNVKTASSLLTGVSYATKYGILSFDYQRTWYGNMKVKGFDEESTESFDSDIASSYKGANNFMVGLEVRPIVNMYLRGGYAFYGFGIQDVDLKYNGMNNISFGVGCRFKSGVGLDLSYVSSSYNSLPYTYFGGDFTDPETGGDIYVASESVISQKVVNNSLALTFSYRF